MEIEMFCGHVLQVDATDAAGSVTCHCGNSRVRRVKAPPPRFRGHASGPLVETVDLGPKAVDLTRKVEGALP